MTSRRGFCPTDETADDITHEAYLADEEEQSFSETTENYVNRIVELCQKNDIELILIKTPDTGWTGKWHEAGQNLADGYGLEFIDFNEPAILDKIGLDDSTDWRNANHLNAAGAEKFTHFLSLTI